MKNSQLPNKEQENELKLAQQLVNQDKFKEAQEKLYLLEEQTKKDPSLLRCQFLLELSITEKEQGLTDSAKLYIEECINTLEKKLNNVDKAQKVDRDYLLADAYFSKANILSKQKDEINSITFLDQSQQLLKICIETINSQSNPQDYQQFAQKIYKKLAIVYTRSTIVNIALRKIAEAKQAILNAQECWNLVDDPKNLKNFKFFQITKAIMDILTGKHDEGIQVLQNYRQILANELGNDQHMARMYMSSLLLLLPIYQKKDQAMYTQILQDFDNGMTVLKSKKEYSFKQLHDQLLPIRKMKF